MWGKKMKNLNENLYDISNIYTIIYIRDDRFYYLYIKDNNR